MLTYSQSIRRSEVPMHRDINPTKHKAFLSRRDGFSRFWDFSDCAEWNFAHAPTPTPETEPALRRRQAQVDPQFVRSIQNVKPVGSESGERLLLGMCCARCGTVGQSPAPDQDVGAHQGLRLGCSGFCMANPGRAVCKELFDQVNPPIAENKAHAAKGAQ